MTTTTLDRPKDLTHQSLTSEHYTPPWVIEMARHIMKKRNIHLDPFTSEAVNNWGAKAKFTCDKELDGFKYLEDLPKYVNSFFERRGYTPSTVHPSAICNPPSEKNGDAARAFRLLHQAWYCGAIGQAVFVAFSLDTDHQCCELTHKLPRLMLRNRLKYWAWNHVKQDFCEGNWQKKGHGDFYVEKSTSTNYWMVLNKDLKILSQHATKDEAIAATDNNCLVWSNSPTKHSTIIVLPPRTNTGWNECLERAQSFELPVEGYWNIPQHPTDLGAK